MLLGFWSDFYNHCNCSRIFDKGYWSEFYGKSSDNLQKMQGGTASLYTLYRVSIKTLVLLSWNCK